MEKTRIIEALGLDSVPTWAIIATAALAAAVIAFGVWNWWSLHVQPVNEIMRDMGVSRRKAKEIHEKEIKEYLESHELNKDSKKNDATK